MHRCCVAHGIVWLMGTCGDFIRSQLVIFGLVHGHVILICYDGAGGGASGQLYFAGGR